MNSTDLDAAARDAAMDVCTQTGPCLAGGARAEFLGLYLIGSLAHGGFSRRYSDIDAAVVTETALSSHTLESLRRQATAMSDEWGPKVSLFWTDRQFGVGRFPPLDRLDYLDRPVVLAERERVTPAPPALGRNPRLPAWRAIRQLGQPRATSLPEPATLDAKDRKGYLRALLYPARLCFSYATGLMTSNDDAVAYLREQTPPGLDLDLDRAGAAMPPRRRRSRSVV